MLDQVQSFLTDYQDRLCFQLKAAGNEPDSFVADNWTRPEGGGGVSRVLEEGQTFEKAGVNYSSVSGQSLPPSATANRPELAGRPFHAAGVSVVCHPRNPYAPTSHANVRFFIAPATRPEEKDVWWFGGGFDLTPYYGNKDDCIAWHQQARQACSPFGPDLYPKFKQWCDEYFFLKHRDEPRGIGGIFFDDYNDGGFDNAFGLMCSVAEHYATAYAQIVSRRKDAPYGERERAFQLYRRGRYVEFNLVWDRGTLFGLQSNGRTESILMSLPPQVTWKYNWTPRPDSREAELYDTYLVPKDWAALGNP